MKKILTLIAFAAISVATFAKTDNTRYVYTEASGLTLAGKLCTDTPNPYHRVDTVRFKGFTKGENYQMRSSSGIYVAFRTNAKCISVKPTYGEFHYPVNATVISYLGFDLYIKKDGKWLWAASGSNRQRHEGEPITMIKDMDGSEHECLLFLPLFAELDGLGIGVEEGARIEAMENPFKCRIGIFGSSFTQGASTSRPGMSYPNQFMRMTGYQMLSLGASGNCKLQPYFADVINAYDFDAFVFDTFSNPNAKMIRERLEPFIQRIRAVHPTEPLIFQQTIYRERRNFNVENEKYEQAKMDTAAELMAEMCKKYPNVYFIRPNATARNHETSVDGTHPGDYGYTLWAESIAPQIVKILKKHGIKL